MSMRIVGRPRSQTNKQRGPPAR